MNPTINHLTDWNRHPARLQIVPPCSRRKAPGALHKLWCVLSQKGDPTLSVINCAYCQKVIEEKDALESELVYINGCQLARKKQKYCSKRCADYDQMAHEG
ncbi:YdaE family protein [Yokenella regensburgei]|uniref:YdaE family protein n=1 Tax=Yokenella regensburgei TaxID=158877 RepID=UPI003EDA35A7